MFIIIDYCLAIIGTILTILFNKLVTSIYDFWIIILLFIIFLLSSYALTFLFIFFSAIPISTKEEFCQKPSKFYRFIFKHGLVFFMYLSRVKIKFIGKELLPKNTKIVVLSNHLSNYDPMVVNKVLPEYDISWIGKKSLFKIPFIGKLIYKIGFIALDRDSLKQGARVANKAIEYIRNNDCSIGIYPEGTRNKGSELLLPLKPGAMKIPLKAGVPLVVLTVSNTNLVAKNWPLKRTTIYVKIQEVFEYEKIKDFTSNQLLEIIEPIMKESVKELKK